MLKLLNAEKILAEASSYCKSLSDTKQRELKESLCNGKALLRSVMSWLNAHCILKAKVMLLHSDMPIYAIAEELGFQSATFFSRFFHRENGVTPSDFRKKQVPFSDTPVV